jgi:hypothetical protein
MVGQSDCSCPGGPPAYGLYARNVKGLTLQNVRFTYEQPDARPAIIFDNVEDASINGLSVMGSAGNEVLPLINSKDVLLTATKILTPAALFLKIEGAESSGIIADGGDLRKANQKTIFDQGALKDAVTLRV